LKTAFFGIDIPKREAKVWDSGNSPYTTTNLSTVGKALVGLFTSAEALQQAKNKYIYIGSHILTQNELIKAVEAATGEKFKIEKLDSKQWMEDGSEKLTKGNIVGAYQMIQGSNLGDQPGNDFSDKLFNHLVLKNVHEDVAEDVKRVVSEL